VWWLEERAVITLNFRIWSEFDAPILPNKAIRFFRPTSMSARSPVRVVFEGEDDAGTSRAQDDENLSDVSENEDGEENSVDENSDTEEAVVKPLTKESLAEFKAAQERAGVIYISRIPPGMRPSKVRHLMTTHGEVGRVYLQQEGAPFIQPASV
jgi:hypothetical protein